MRRIERVGQYKRDYRRVKATPDYKDVDGLLGRLIDLLARDASLPENHHDHPLRGRWRGFRECHVYPDLLLIYEKPDPQRLRLMRLASHSELRF